MGMEEINKLCKDKFWYIMVQLSQNQQESFKRVLENYVREVASKAIDMAWARIIENGKFRSYTKEEILKSLDIKEGD